MASHLVAGAPAEAGGAPAEPGLIASGRIKWFDAVKGYGFILADDGGGDILVHYNLLAQHGRKTLPEAARLEVLAVDGPRGRQASEIVSLDLTDIPEQASGHQPRRTGNRVEPLDYIDAAGGFEPVQVRWFNRARGYGFLLRNDGVTQVFVHMETVRRGGLEILEPDQPLMARIHDGPRGALAVEIAVDTTAEDRR